MGFKRQNLNILLMLICSVYGLTVLSNKIHIQFKNNDTFILHNCVPLFFSKITMLI